MLWSTLHLQSGRVRDVKAPLTNKVISVKLDTLGSFISVTPDAAIFWYLLVVNVITVPAAVGAPTVF